MPVSIPSISEPWLYRVVSFGGQPVIALPETSRRARLAGLARFQPSTWRRAIFRHGLRMAVGTGLDRFLARRTADPINEADNARLTEAIQHLERTLGQSHLVPTIVWPPQPDRGRVYVHLMREDGSPCAFAKIGLDAANVAKMRVEVTALRRFEMTRPHGFRAPCVLEFEHTADFALAAFEPVPTTAHPGAQDFSSFPSEAVAEYSQPVERVDLRDETQAPIWWRRFRSTARPEQAAFRAELDQLLDADPVAPLTFAHGDLGPGNILITGRQETPPWIIDWEESDPLAPIRTDPVGFALGVTIRALAADPVRAGQSFVERHLAPRDDRTGRRDDLLALAFRTARGFEDVRVLVDRWESIS